MNIEQLQSQLKRLRMTGLLETLEQRLLQAQEKNLVPLEFLELILQDEIERREGIAFGQRLRRAQFEEVKTLEKLDLNRYALKIQSMIKDLIYSRYIQNHQHVLIMGPTGAGKSHLAQGLGHQACRQGHSVYFVRANALLRQLHASRADHSWDKVFKKLLSCEVLIVDDFGLKNLDHDQADDIYELIAERYLKKSIIVTSNRTLEGWVDLFPDPVVANAALDRLANLAYQLVLEAPSHRREQRPMLQANPSTQAV